MKRILFYFFAAALIATSSISFVSCSKDDEPNNAKNIKSATLISTCYMSPVFLDYFDITITDAAGNVLEFDEEMELIDKGTGFLDNGVEMMKKLTVEKTRTTLPITDAIYFHFEPNKDYAKCPNRYATIYIKASGRIEYKDNTPTKIMDPYHPGAGMVLSIDGSKTMKEMQSYCDHMNSGMFPGFITSMFEHDVSMTFIGDLQ